MSQSTYSGSCHCGAVRFEAALDLVQGTLRCNCSICSKARSWFAITPAGAVRILQGESELASYEWTPPNRDHPNLHYRFCKKCGVRAFAQGDQLPGGGPFVAVAIAALDNVNEDELADRIKYVDGRNDRYDREPQDTRLV